MEKRKCLYCGKWEYEIYFDSVTDCCLDCAAELMKEQEAQ